jgi:polysaccharide biosynthesis protein PslF
MQAMQIEQAGLLKLLVITGTWPPMRCGVGDYASMLCEHLSHLAVSVHVLTSRQARPDLRLGGHSHLEVHPVVENWSWPTLALIRRLVAELKPDVINLQWPTAAYGRSVAVNWLPVSLALHFPKIPFVTTLHELRYFRPLTRLRIWPALFLSRRLIVVDPLDMKYIHGLHVAQRCVHIPIASNLPATPKGFDRAGQRRRLGFSEADFVVGFFGFANPPKGLETLFVALRQLRPRHPNLKLLLLSQLSEQNTYERRLLHELKDSGLDAVTVRPAYAEPRQAAEILAAADCAALPYTDGVSVKRGSLMACLAQGLPIVTTLPARGEAGDFHQGENLLLVPPRDAAALAGALEKLLGDPDLRARLALGAWDLARSFSWEDIARRQLEVFEAAAKGKA